MSEETTTGKRRPVPPPAQLLCEALSVVCGREVEVFPGLGAWGGEGWIKRKKSRLRSPSSSFSSTGQQDRIVLPLIQQQTSSSSDSEWSQLQSALQTITLNETNPFCTVLPVRYKKGSVSTAALWHGKTHGSAMRDIIDETINAFGSTTKSGDIASANKDGLGQCLSIMSKYLAKILVSWLDEDSNSHDQEEDESDEDDLFSEYYQSSTPQPTRTSTTATGELIELCSKPNASLVVTKKMLSDIIAQSSDGHRLARSILQQALNHLPAPDQKVPLRTAKTANTSSSTSFDTITKDLVAVSHLMANSADIAISLAKEMKGMDTASGKSFELSSILRPLL